MRERALEALWASVQRRPERSGERTCSSPTGLEQKEKIGHLPYLFFLIDVRERIRTPDTLVRSQVLYPAELHTHILF